MTPQAFDIDTQSDILPPGGKVLYAVLNWGIGHAVRSVPVIAQLLSHGHPVVLASDGAALELLKKEFPGLPYFTLPAWDIRYPRNGHRMMPHLGKQLPRLWHLIKRERKAIDGIVRKEKPQVIISDNRFGARHPECLNIYITHQLKVLAGIFTPVATGIHRHIAGKYDYIWVPDIPQAPGLAGKLSHGYTTPKVRHTGWLSSKFPLDIPVEYGITAVLSGPEPQRQMLEDILIRVFRKLPGTKTALVRGVVDGSPDVRTGGTVNIYNYLHGDSLNRLLNASEYIVSRSGYTTLMDMAILGKKAIYIPTPGQTEQEYLARLQRQSGKAVVMKQDETLAGRLYRYFADRYPAGV